MTRGLFYVTGSLAAIALLVLALVKMGAPGWFTLTFALVLLGVTIAFLWPALLVLAIGYAIVRLGLWRARRGGGLPL